MNESMLTGILAGAAVITAGMAIASFRILEGDPVFAEVLTVQPILQAVQKPREECPDELVAETLPGKAEHGMRTAFAVTSLVAAPVARIHGAGNSSERARATDSNSPGRTDEAPSADGKSPSGSNAPPKCRTVYDRHLETVGYDVVYRLGDREGTVRMDHDPGERIPVRDGELVLTFTPR